MALEKMGGKGDVTGGRGRQDVSVGRVQWASHPGMGSWSS